MNIKATFYIFLLVISANLSSQTEVFKEGVKYGIRENQTVIIPPVHDTIFNFDSTGKVCLACTKIRGAHANKYIRTPTITFYCRYLNKKAQHLFIQQDNADTTTSIFSLHKITVPNYNNNSNIMTVEVKNTKHVVTKDFKQITSKGYDDIHLSPDPAFFVAAKKDEGGSMMHGLIDRNEQIVLPFRYSHFKFNTKDSLIIGCTAGQGANSEDDIYGFDGKKVSSFHRHVELATKKFIVHKIFIPKEYFLIVNLETKEEKAEYAEEARYYKDMEILMMNEGHWFTYNIVTHKKKAYDLKHKK